MGGPGTTASTSVLQLVAQAARGFSLHAFNIDGSENAPSQALGMHKSALKALGLSPDLSPDGSSIHLSKVSNNVTTDSAPPW
jgi:hypothetical protein